MPTIIVRHTVKDFDAWKPYYDEHATSRERYGIHDGGLYREAEEPRNVVMVFQTDDIDRAQEFFTSEELRETMQKAGVVSEPTVWILNAA
jgi:uncharacterized protein (DUF1330 family)